MSRITLIAGESDYSKIIRRVSEKDGPVLTFTEKKDSTEGAAGTPDDSVKKRADSSIQWNKRSPLSARNSVLTVLNRHGRIDDAFVIYQPGSFNKTFHEISSPVYDLQIDRWIKGYGYLLKELIQLFIKQQSGRLSFIIDTGGIKMMTPVESAILSYLRSLVQNLSILYQNESFRIMCFESDSAKREEFLEFLIKTMDDQKPSPGKNHKFSDKKGLFDFTRKL